MLIGNQNVYSLNKAIISLALFPKLSHIQSTPVYSNLPGKSQKDRVSGSSSYQELEANNWK